MAAKNSSDDSRSLDRLSEVMKTLKKLRDNMPPNVGLLDYNMREVYHAVGFWRNICFTPSDILDGKIIRRAFRDMCRLLSLSSEPSDKAMNLACLLAGQLRSPENHQSLLVDQEKFRPTFRMGDPESIEDWFIQPDEEEKFFGTGVHGVRDFLFSIDAMDEEEAAIVGPAIACVIVTLKKCSSGTAADKIFHFANNVNIFYPRLEKMTVRLPSRENLIAILDKTREAYFADVLKNTVVLGCMYAYHKQDLTVETKEMLDSLVLKSFRFTSMQVLTFIDDVTKTYDCQVDDYRRLTQVFYQGDRSWRAYAYFMEKHGPGRGLVGDEQDSFWMYAREFNHRVFQELTYNNNKWLCNFSADLLDLKRHPDQVKPWPALGPTYQSLTRYKRSKNGLLYYEEHHKWALEVHNKLN